MVTVVSEACVELIIFPQEILHIEQAGRSPELMRRRACGDTMPDWRSAGDAASGGCSASPKQDRLR